MKCITPLLGPLQAALGDEHGGLGVNDLLKRQSRANGINALRAMWQTFLGRKWQPSEADGAYAAQDNLAQGNLFLVLPFY